MPPFLIGIQIFTTLLLSMIITFQNSSSDGIVTNNNNRQVTDISHTTFSTKLTVILITIFIFNSLILAKYTFSEHINNKSIVQSLEDKEINHALTVSTDNIPKME